MKKIKIERKGPSKLTVILALLVVTMLIAGGFFCYNQLMRLYQNQCLITDMNEQIVISSGKMIKPDVLAEEFGLKKGANLARIDFDARRQAILRKIPNIRTITVQRRLPDKVYITVEERQPIARLDIRGKKTVSGKVVDAEGVVFICQRGTRLLPVIRESPTSVTGVGQTLTGRAHAALELLDTCRSSDYQEFNLLEIELASPDYLLATLGTSYAKLKIAWDGMSEAPTPASHASLLRQLTHVRNAIRSRVCPNAVIWNATDFSKPGRIYADTKEFTP